MTTGQIRFSGMERLFGEAAFAKLHHAHIAVVGLGGVGSWVVESLVRSGIGALTLIDMDEVCLSNSNRQIQALTSTVGQFKTDVLKQRCLDINPKLKINAITQFVTPETVENFFSEPFDGLVDATDSPKAKCAMALVCKQNKIPMVMVGASGGKNDPLQIVVDDLNQSINDYLLRDVRRRLRTDHGVARSSKNFGIKVVFSREMSLYPDGGGGVCVKKLAKSAKLDCQSGVGSASFVTGVFGFVAARTIIMDILK